MNSDDLEGFQIARHIHKQVAAPMRWTSVCFGLLAIGYWIRIAQAVQCTTEPNLWAVFGSSFRTPCITHVRIRTRGSRCTRLAGRQYHP